MSGKSDKVVAAMIWTICVMVGSLWAEQSITIERVQQRWPWNGLVDIDYTVQGVDNPTNHFVRFTANDGSKDYVLSEFFAKGTLLNASNGSWRVTWDSHQNAVDYLPDTTTLRAEIVQYPGPTDYDRTVTPYPSYVLIDVSGGEDATAYPVRYEVFEHTAAATNKYNGADTTYKTGTIVMRKIHRGAFQMGSPTDEVGREGEVYMGKESLHSVELTQDYYLGVFPVTRQQYLNVTGTDPSANAGGSLLCPVENVSYAAIRGASAQAGCNVHLVADGAVDMTSFLGRIRERSGLTTLDLPTEAQWERACREDTQTPTFIGADVTAEELDKYAFWGSRSGSSTQPVGLKWPSRWGLYDLLGNVWERCRDRVQAYNEGGDDWGEWAQTDPVRGGDTTRTYTVLRGGSFGDVRNAIRAACRALNYDTTATESGCADHTGFRLSMTVSDIRNEIAAIGKPVGAVGKVAVIDLKRDASGKFPVICYTNIDIGVFNTWTYKARKLVLREIPEGAYTIGQIGDLSQQGVTTRDMTNMTVTVNGPYYMGVFTLTEQQYDRAMGFAANNLSSATHPKGRISYNQLRSGQNKNVFPNDSLTDNCVLKILSNACGSSAAFSFDLPTEVLWEVAARAGSTARYGSYLPEGSFVPVDGSEETVGLFAWYEELGAPMPVGLKRPNAWGLFDTEGNVWEWCRDILQPEIPDNPSPDPLVPFADESASYGLYRSLRGASFNVLPIRCRPSHRSGRVADEVDATSVGLRLCGLPTTALPSVVNAEILAGKVTRQVDGPEFGLWTAPVYTNFIGVTANFHCSTNAWWWNDAVSGLSPSVTINQQDGTLAENVDPEVAYGWVPTKSGTYVFTHQPSGVTATFVVQFDPNIVSRLWFSDHADAGPSYVSLAVKIEVGSGVALTRSVLESLAEHLQIGSGPNLDAIDNWSDVVPNTTRAGGAYDVENAIIWIQVDGAMETENLRLWKIRVTPEELTNGDDRGQSAGKPRTK